MTAQHTCLLFALCLLATCATIMLSLLIVVLWPIKVLFAYDLLGLGISVVLIVVGVWALSRLNEMRLRHRRYRYREEIPLDRRGYPLYVPLDAQALPDTHQQQHHHPYDTLKQERRGYHGDSY